MTVYSVNTIRTVCADSTPYKIFDRPKHYDLLGGPSLSPTDELRDCEKQGKTHETANNAKPWRKLKTQAVPS